MLLGFIPIQGEYTEEDLGVCLMLLGSNKSKYKNWIFRMKLRNLGWTIVRDQRIIDIT